MPGTVRITRNTRKFIATIANGASLSDAIDLDGQVIAAIVMPAAFTGTALTFQASADGVTYQNVYDDAGTELSASVGQAKVIVNKSILESLAALRYVKIRSGSAASPTAEAADRTLTILTKG
ncbi:MAG TPA: hypothetical protein VFM38_15355 [Candidatus Limnocylindrales bacterium]|nr:hypothetical protein [Candidatus Limnocylindrales bacterium]